MSRKKQKREEVGKMKVLFAIFEAEPFAKTGGLGDVGGALPAYLKKAGCQTRVIMPKYAGIPQIYKDKLRPVANFKVDVGWRRQYCGLEELDHDGIRYYFIDNEYYFGREGLYGYYDDGERVAFFGRAVLESLLMIKNFKPDVIHCNDWHTAVIPVLLREICGSLPFYYGIKSVFTIHNLKYQGVYDEGVLADLLGLYGHTAPYEKMGFDGGVNFLKGALLYSDAVTTVSPSYAQEIQHAYYGERLDAVLRMRSGSLCGILNGLDYDLYDPETDRALFANYSSRDWTNKKENKRRLREMLGLPPRGDEPLLTMVTRLTEQKGMDLFFYIAEELLAEDLQIVVVGAGEWQYEQHLRWLASQYPNKFAACVTFDNDLAMKVYSAGDIILMPSKFEPCGVTQMIAMRYGNLPAVRETGGLKDTVRPFDEHAKTGNGFSFANYNAHELLFTVKNALRVYRQAPLTWEKLRQNAAGERFRWEDAAVRYLRLYEKIGART
ncbi:MAG: glycogen synthase GlgA [Gracilibacteraceae bacterium]|jgi:starch synthase|nr:glycogen synthase GlgA [Gracilibacteraceae bacterium]